MVTKRKILVPIDFNERSIEMALPYAAEWAKRFSMEIDLLHVIEESGIFSKLFSGEDNEKLKDNIRNKLNEIAEKTEEQYGIRTDAMVTQGRVTNKINEVAELLNPDVIIMSSGNQVNESTNTIGANTHRIVRVTDHPVLIVRHANYPKELKKILVPMDLSTNSRLKIPDVVDLAEKTKATVCLIYGCWGDEDISEEKKLNVVISQSLDSLRQHQITCEVHQIPRVKTAKNHVEEIAKYAEKQEMELIIVVGRADTITDQYMDYTAQDLIRLSPIPVLCIAPKPIGIQYAGRI